MENTSHQPRVQRLTACPVCGGGDLRSAFDSEDLLHGVPGTYSYERCRSCKSVFQDPRVVVEDLRLCYPDQYFTHHSGVRPVMATSGGSAARLRWEILRHADGRAAGQAEGAVLAGAARLLWRVGAVRRRARFGLLDPLGLDREGRRCLEVGPGQGYDMLRLAHLGWDVVGLEVDEEAAARAASLSGHPVVHGSLEDRPWPDATFDLIYATHVLEHLPDPRRSLRLAFELLSPGGRIVLVYPNPDSLVGRMYGRWAVTWDPPRHLVLPPGSAIRSLLEDIGFSNVRVTSLSRRARGWAAIARYRRDGERGADAWSAKTNVGDRAIGLLEAIAPARLGLGEELVVVAERA